MNYRITQEFKPPFTINTLIEEAGSLKVQLFWNCIMLRIYYDEDL